MNAALNAISVSTNPQSLAEVGGKNRLEQAVVERLRACQYFVSANNVDFVELVINAVVDHPLEATVSIGSRVSRHSTYEIPST